MTRESSTFSSKNRTMSSISSGILCQCPTRDTIFHVTFILSYSDSKLDVPFSVVDKDLRIRSAMAEKDWNFEMV